MHLHPCIDWFHHQNPHRLRVTTWNRQLDPSSTEWMTFYTGWVLTTLCPCCYLELKKPIEALSSLESFCGLHGGFSADHSEDPLQRRISSLSTSPSKILSVQWVFNSLENACKGLPDCFQVPSDTEYGIVMQRNINGVCRRTQQTDMHIII